MPIRSIRRGITPINGTILPSKQFNLRSLSPGQRKQVEQGKEVANAVLIKAFLHTSNPRRYPIATQNSFEARAAAMVAASRVLQTRGMRGFKKLMRSPDKVNAMLGSQVGLDFRQPEMAFVNLTVRPRFSDAHLALPPPAVILQRPPDAAQGERIEETFADVPVTQPPLPPPPQPVPLTHLTMEIIRIQCIDETDPEGGADNIVFGGAKVEADGTPGTLNAFACGQFDDWTEREFGAVYAAHFDLSLTAGYPKIVYSLISLIESDSDDAEVVRGVTGLITIAASIVIGFISAGAGVVFGQLISAIGIFVEGLMDEDVFPVYGIDLLLERENQWGGPRSPIYSADISGHGGTYRIFYRWTLTAA